MKQTIIISIIMLIGNFVFGQSIVTTNKQWYNFIQYYNIGGGIIDSTEHIKFTTDTVINSITYKHVKRVINENQENWSSYGFIRENDSNQVFYKINAGGPECLLYKMNAQSHQTVFVYGLNTGFTNENLDSMSYYVRNIDSVLIDQSYHRRINLTIPEDTSWVIEQWIDSIGSLGGMLHNQYLYVGCDYYFLQCCFENGVLQYHDSTYEDCVYISGIDEKTVSTPTVTVFPNPISDISTMEINGVVEINSISICFYDLLGKEIYQISGVNRMTISKNNFIPGIYFFSVTTCKGVIGSGKIIID